MADNPSIDPGTSPSIPVASDDVGGVQYQRVKLRAADDGSAGSDVSAANPLPVVQTGTPALPTGAATETTQAAQSALLGAVNETAPATDTANSGLNGRIQRACQRLTSILAVLPAALGQTTKAGSLSVTLASNQDALPITDNAGSLTVDNAGTFAIQDSQKLADNAAFTDGTTPLQPVGYVFDEVAGTALTENDIAAARVDSKRAVVGVIEDATTRGQRLAVSAAGAAKVDGSAVTQPVSAVSLPLPAGASTEATLSSANTAIGTTADAASSTTGTVIAHLRKIRDLLAATLTVSGTVTTTPPANASTNVAQVGGTATDTNSGTKSAGTQRVVLATDQPALTNALKVDGSAVTQPVSNGGTFAVQSAAAGDTAHDAADAGNPVKVGGKARSADITSVSAADRTDLQTDLQGRVIVQPYNQDESNVDGTTGASPLVDTTSTAIIAAGAAGVRTYLTHIVITNGHATVDTRVQILDGATVRCVVFAKAAGGGASLTLPKALRGTAATAWNAKCVTTGSSVDVSMSGYQSKE